MSAPENISLTVEALARSLNLQCRGRCDASLRSVASFTSAGTSDLCFLTSPRYIDQARRSACAAVIVPVDFGEDLGDKALIFSPNPHLSFVRAIAILQPESVAPPDPSIHASAIIHDSARIADDVFIGEHCVIGPNVEIGSATVIGAGCVIEQGCRVGEASRLHPRVTLCHDVHVGDRVILHPGVVIGSDGFGLVYDQGDWVKIPHLGCVRIGDDVEIGANTTVDRGALDDTVIERGVKMDNLIQVAHNVHIGENTAIAACVGIAGSAVIGKNCRISGAAVVLGHLSVADNTTVTAMSLVTKSITESGTYSSGTPLMENRMWHRNNARYKMLDQLAKDLANLQKNQQEKT